MTSAVLHIGTPKTGTSFIQKTFAGSRDSLQREGVAYPVFEDTIANNHNALALAFNNNATNQRRKYRITDPSDALAGYAHALKAASESGDRVVLSGESGARLTDEQAGELYSFLRKFFDEVTILVYFRRRDHMLASNFSQRLKAGDGINWRESIGKLKVYDPNAILDRWSRIAGESNVVSRPYLESFKQSPGTLLADFCDQVGVDAGTLTPPGTEDLMHRNISLTAEGAQLMQALIPQLPASLGLAGRSNLALHRQLVARILQITRGGAPLRIPPETLELANEAFAESNTKLMARNTPDPQWQEWSNQPRPQVDTGDAMTAPRTAELILALSAPDGPLDFSQPDWRPPVGHPRKRIAEYVKPSRWLN